MSDNEVFEHVVAEILAFIEASMRPGKLSEGGFLGKDEKLVDVLRADNETVMRLGLTHEKIADRIEYFINAVNTAQGFQGEGKLVDGKYLVGGKAYRGFQECPWGDTDTGMIGGKFMAYSCFDLYVRNQEIGEQLNFPGGIVHLIREHHFYEGRQSPYRVDPEKAVRVLDIK